ncbi:MAG: acyl-CoA desaturase [Vampirovibrio sp.]|nr:acyl-CoA desaturase [Vampirovibrio sp.]
MNTQILFTQNSAMSWALPGWLAWLDSDHVLEDRNDDTDKKWVWHRLIPFAFLHLGCLAVVFTGWSWTAVGVAVLLYWVRMFAITGFYHRYFSHRSFKTTRLAQFFFAILGLSAIQRGPLWWAAHHREHHRVSDQAGDIHSPVQEGFWWSHMGWITRPANMVTHYSRIKDLTKFPELVFLNRFDWLVPVLYALGLFVLGAVLETFQPGLGTNGLQLLVWCGFISTVVLFHGTCTINSLCHVFGAQRYDTGDDSRNNLWLALITLGEGWHNNHHQYPGAARQGFYWWEIDMTYYGLKLLEAVGIIWDLHPVPASVYSQTFTSANTFTTSNLNPSIQVQPRLRTSKLMEPCR